MPFKASLTVLVTFQHQHPSGREKAEQPGTVAIRGKGRKEVEGVCVQVGKGTCDVNWGVVSSARRSSRCSQDQLRPGSEL